MSGRLQQSIVFAHTDRMGGGLWGLREPVKNRLVIQREGWMPVTMVLIFEIRESFTAGQLTRRQEAHTNLSLVGW